MLWQVIRRDTLTTHIVHKAEKPRLIISMEPFSKPSQKGFHNIF